jgi:hypothetical protein
MGAVHDDAHKLVAARTVAEALAELATAPKVAESPIPEIAGPRVESLVEVAKLLAVRGGDSVRIEGVTDPADPDGELYLTDALPSGPYATLAGPTFEESLEHAVPLSATAGIRRG